MAGRIRGNTIPRCDGEPTPRRTQPIRQRRRTDIRTLHLLSASPTRPHHERPEGWWRPGTANSALTKAVSCPERQASLSTKAPGLHPTDESLLVCQTSLPVLIGRRRAPSTPRGEFPRGVAHRSRERRNFANGWADLAPRVTLPPTVMAHIREGDRIVHRLLRRGQKHRRSPGGERMSEPSGIRRRGSECRAPHLSQRVVRHERGDQVLEESASRESFGQRLLGRGGPGLTRPSGIVGLAKLIGVAAPQC